jgi:alanyl aminopeptidase
MKIKSSLRLFVAMVGLLALITSVQAADLRLATKVVPTFQSIQLKIDAEQEEYSGSVSVELNVTQATDTFRFHAEGQSFERIELRDAEGAEVTLQTARGKDGVVTVSTESELIPGKHTLEIDFTNRFNTQAVGLYRMLHEDRGYLFTQLEAVDARKAFPCWDEPRFKIPFQMTLVVPAAQVAVSNTPVESEKIEGAWKTVVFRKTPPMPSYLLAIASGPLESVPIMGMSVPGRVYTVQGQSHLAGLTAEMSPPILAALERYFGQSYPYEKLDLIAVPEYWFGGMENPGAVVCDDAAILLDPAAASNAQKRNLAGLLAHEFAHMWYGDLVTMEWWDDLWLNEAFATYMGQKITHELYPEYGGDLARRRQVQGLMSADARPSTKPIRGKIDSTAAIFEDLGLAYGKGRTVLGMMERWIGPEAFRDGVTSYIEANAWGNTVGDDLWAALSKASEMDVGGPMSSFLDQSGLPLIDIAVGADGEVTLSQRRFLNYGVEAEPQTWTVPVNMRYHDGEIIRTKSVLLDEKTAKFKVGGNVEWIFPDDGAIGYYRWNLPSEMLVDLAENSTERLTAPERIVFVGNAAALLDAGRISGGDYLRVLNLFADDPEPEVVSSVVSGLGKVEGAFVPDELRDEFADYVRATLRPVLDRFGMEAVDGEDETVSILRSRLVSWLGEAGRDPEVRQYATKLAKSYMADSRSVDPSLAGTALSLAAAQGDRALYDSFKKRFETAKTPVERERYLAALGSFEDPKIRQAALSYVLSGSLRPNEVFTIPSGMAKTEKDADLVFEWVTGHYGELTAPMPAMMRSFMPFAASGCSAQRLQTAKKFFSEPDHKVDGTEANLQKVSEQVNDCVNLRRREGQAVATYLQEFAD